MADSTLPPERADRGLLLAVLGLQLDFVGKTDLQNALRAWGTDRSRPLGEVLVERGVLAPRRRVLLEELAGEYLAQHDMDVSRGLAAACAARAVPIDIDAITGPAPRGDLATLPSAPRTRPVSGAGDVPCLPAVGLPTSSGLRFRHLRPHARGALGVVYVALDEELHREVALKEIQEPYQRSADSRARFLQEAEITGQLEHPGVVPVYGLGQHADGRPYYAMRFIRGQSLQDAVTRFHQGDVPGRDPRARAFELRGLLRRFVDICNAIAYAHSRGVIHRDIKPSNVMLGRYGETLVVDWGLAKSFDRPCTADSTEIVVHPVTTAQATMLGQTVGTPAFMSPEQAAGRVDEVGPASDIYALGATLYALLTGMPPFPGFDASAVMKQVIARDFPAPRLVKRQVPAALESVVLKAMEEKPQDRYPSAAALAHEVERWLADEPVSAYREPAWQRGQRWARRHRTLVSGLVVLLLTTVIGLTVGLYFVGRARDQARQNLARAEENLELAKAAVDQCFYLATEDPSLQTDRMRGVRRLLLREALPFYQNFSKQRPDDTAIVEETGRSHSRVAVITAEIGRKEDALKSHEAARDVYARLAAREPAEERHRINLARVCNDLGNLQSETGRRDDAIGSHEEAMRLREELAAGGLPESRADLAATLTNLGVLKAGEGRAAEARALYVRAAEIQRDLVARHDTDRYRRELAGTLHNLGVVLAASKDEAAAGAYREARDLREKLQRAEAGSPRRRAELADTLLSQGVLFSETGRFDDAGRGFEKARDLFAALADEYREVAEYRSGQANALLNLGDLLAQTGRHGKARPAYRQAESLLERLVEEHAAVVRYRIDLAGTRLGLASTHREAGQAEAELAALAQVFELLGQIEEAEPGRPGPRALARKAHERRARALDRAKRHRDAVADWSAAEKLAEEGERADLRVGRATSLAKAGDPAAAMKELTDLQREKSPTGERLYSLACVASLSAAASRGAESGRCAAAAVGLLERARQAGLFGEAEMVAHLEKDSDLDALRGREDFRSFVSRVRKE